MLPKEIILVVYSKLNTITDLYNLSAVSMTYYELMKQTEYYRELTKFNDTKKYLRLLMSKLCEKDNIIFPLIYKNYVNKINENIDEIKKIAYKCCKNGCIKNIEFLLNNNNFDDLTKTYMLSISCYSGNLNLVKQLLHINDNNFSTQAAMDMIIFAHRSGNPKLVSYLLKIKIIPKIILCPKTTPKLFEFILEFDFIDIVKDFCSDDREYVEGDVDYCLKKCAEFDSCESFKFLVDEFEVEDDLIEYCLIFAVTRNSYNIIKYIIENYDNIGLHSNVGNNIFSYLHQIRNKDLSYAKFIIHIYMDCNDNIQNENLRHSIDYIFIFSCLNDWFELASFVYKITIIRYSTSINIANYEGYISKQNINKIKKCEKNIKKSTLQM